MYFTVLFIDNEQKPLQCVNQYNTNMCSMFCLHYIHDWSSTYSELEKWCNGLHNGEVVKVDRELKQHCVIKLLGKNDSFIPA